MNKYELVPELKDWDAHNGGEMSPEGWVCCMGTYSHAVGYASLIWPRFVEIKGMIFREGVEESSVLNWLKNPDRSNKEVEAMLNHLHILDIQHPGIWSDVTESQIRYLGETLRASWAAK